MTRPTFIAFCNDEVLYENKHKPKIYLRTLIYSTSIKGHIVENMFVKVSRDESAQTFNIWVYGEKELARGSGIYIGPNGGIFHHHFLLPSDGTSYEFLAGNYLVEIYASILGRKNCILLQSLKLMLGVVDAKGIKENKAVYFDWMPNIKKYCVSLQEAPSRKRVLEDLVKLANL